MKATIQSTVAICEMKDILGRTFTARVWEGMTEEGIGFTAYIPVVQVLRTEDNGEFERELSEHIPVAPSTQRAIDARFVI